MKPIRFSFVDLQLTGWSPVVSDMSSWEKQGVFEASWHAQNQ